jgi:ribosomal protein S6
MSVENDEGDDEPGEPERLDDLPKGVRQRLEAFVPELVKKTITAGMGAVFTTEEGLRRLSKEITLPKEVASYIVNTASTTKDELLRIIAGEVREFLQTINLSEEIARMLTMLSFEVKTEIRFIPNDQKYTGVEPQVKAEVRLKRSDDRRRRRRFRRRREGGESPPPDDGPGD